MKVIKIILILFSLSFSLLSYSGPKKTLEVVDLGEAQLRLSSNWHYYTSDILFNEEIPFLTNKKLKALRGNVKKKIHITKNGTKFNEKSIANSMCNKFKKYNKTLKGNKLKTYIKKNGRFNLCFVEGSDKFSNKTIITLISKRTGALSNRSYYSYTFIFNYPESISKRARIEIQKLTSKIVPKKIVLKKK